MTNRSRQRKEADNFLNVPCGNHPLERGTALKTEGPSYNMARSCASQPSLPRKTDSTRAADTHTSWRKLASQANRRR